MSFIGPATLADFERNGFGLRPICRKCWHQGAAMAPAALAERHALPMSAAPLQTS